MNITTILETYDSMFGKFSLDQIEDYLTEQIQNAKSSNDLESLMTLLNEIIGFCRDTTQKEKALNYCKELFDVLDQLKLNGTMPYATSLLNIANAYRAFNLPNESIDLYHGVYEIYQQNLQKTDFLYASLFNNWSLVYQEIGQFEKSVELLFQALKIVDLYQDAIIPQATTRTNLGNSFIGIGTKTAYDEAALYIQQALDLFEKDGGVDFHYSAALVSMADLLISKKEYQRAITYYERGLYEIEKHTGKNENYQRVLEKYYYAKDTATVFWRSNLDHSKDFYLEKGKSMIHDLFPEYEAKIAVGLVGEGSDCFGFDDEISTDHDYGLGFCMWLKEEDYVAIGKQLQQAYEEMFSAEMNRNHRRLSDRRGVFSINEFYNHLLKTAWDYENHPEISLENIKEEDLAAATNGEIFSDPCGIFTHIRNQLFAYYPEELRRKKLAQCIHNFSQYAQSNYARTMARKDSITATICIGRAMESILDLMYLLERKYAPYYKWKHQGIKNSPLGKKILPILEKISQLPSQKNVWEGYRYSSASVHTADANVSFFEEISKELLLEMKKQNLVEGDELFLEYYIPQLLKGKNMDLIEKIVKEEWQQFDLVKNTGGRADCQDDFETFSIMRKSQYQTWERPLLESFYNDLCTANTAGWNLIMEKYARMMESTNPTEYAALKKELPVLSNERIQIQEEIIKIQVNWMEEFSQKYPNLSQNARKIHTFEDSRFHTSYETYLRGELGTYSENTFLLYTGFIIQLLKEERNLAYEIMKNTVLLYGYQSLEDADQKGCYND